jgi:chromosome segregation ATPase
MLNKNDLRKVSQPALLPLHGVQDKKPRYLDRDAIIIGRARGCDLCLDAPDISNLHAVISRTAEGFRIRDCGSRSGTKINGESVKTAALQDGDVVQMGLFCFTVQVPAAPLGKAVSSAKFDHLQKSRLHLARQGLRLRLKLQKLSDCGMSRTPNELTRKASDIKLQIRSYDQRHTELEQAERELEQERDKLRKERETHMGHIQHVELDLGRRLAEADAEIHKRWQEFQQRCQQEEARPRNASHAPAGLVAPAQDPNLQEQLREQKEELDLFAQELQQEQERVDSAQNHLDEELRMLRKQRQEISTMQEQLNGQKVQVAADQDRVQTSLAHVEASLAEQRRAMAQMMADMAKVQQALLARGQEPEVKVQEPVVNGHDLAAHAEFDENLRTLQGENDRLQARIAELEKHLANSHADNADLTGLCGDHELLRQLLKDETSAPANPAVVEQLRNENVCLTQLLEAKEQEIGLLKKEATPVTRGTVRESDLENYEAELNQYRRQLDEERAKLTTEVEQMRQRNVELDESVREMEMEMSRERAELARERQRLDRMREEVRIEMERLQRDAPVRESLVGVQKLRDEINKGKQPTPGNALNDRLKSFRNRPD